MFDIKSLLKKYKMTDLEKKALEIANIWLQTSRKLIPEYNHGKIGKGDPRKSFVFKICYKLARETEGLISEDNMPLYIRAQLDILKRIEIDGCKPLINVNCLVGQQAWKRWKVWKKKYDETVRIRSKVHENKISNSKIQDALKKTKDFFSKTFGSDITYEQFKEIEKTGSLYRYINFGKISPYYLVLSPHFQKLKKEKTLKPINFDLNLYKNGIDQDCEKLFRNLFSIEFN